MLRLFDACARRKVPFDPPRGSILRMWVSGSRLQSPLGLRTLVMADVARRVLEELHAVQVFVTLVGVPHAESREVARALSALWIPAAPMVESAPEAPVHLVVGSDVPNDGATLDDGGTLHLSVGPVEAHLETGQRLLLEGQDALALRLALLSTPYDRRVVLDAPAVQRAEETLRRWRGVVAECAGHPSAPLPRWVRDRVYPLLNNNFSVSALVPVVNSLTCDERVAPGARFETLVHLDRFLGLDLPRHLGAHA